MVFRRCASRTEEYPQPRAGRRPVPASAQLVSASTAAAIRELFEGEEAAAEVCEVIHAGFDVLNCVLCSATSRCDVAGVPPSTGSGRRRYWSGYAS